MTERRWRRNWSGKPRVPDTICNICGGTERTPEGFNGHSTVCPFGPDQAIQLSRRGKVTRQGPNRDYSHLNPQDAEALRRLDEECDRALAEADGAS